MRNDIGAPHRVTVLATYMQLVGQGTTEPEYPMRRLFQLYLDDGTLVLSWDPYTEKSYVDGCALGQLVRREGWDGKG